MDTLKSIVKVIQSIGAIIAGGALVVLALKMVTEPEQKERYIKLIKNVLIASVLVFSALVIVEIPKSYYGSTVEIADTTQTKMTFDPIKDKDKQDRETLFVEGKWYVITDTDQTIRAENETSPFLYDKYNIYFGYKEIKADILRPFSECQGWFSGYYAEVSYYRDADGFIFPTKYTYTEYIKAKEEMSQSFRRRCRRW